ncbi:MAG: hypothetical protein II117_06665 [Clostridia bacterium]|nr:hypothetical protein [Clostridia bacterium]
MERLVLIALIGSVTAMQMRSVRQEYAVLIGGATAAFLLADTLIRVTGLSDVFLRACGEYGVPSALPGTVLKILGIAYLTEFGVNVSKDAGQHAVAGTLEIGGKLLMLSCSLPAVVSLLETGAALIREAAP